MISGSSSSVRPRPKSTASPSAIHRPPNTIRDQSGVSGAAMMRARPEKTALRPTYTVSSTRDVSGRVTMSSPTRSESAPTTTSTTGGAPRTRRGTTLQPVAGGLWSSRIIRPMIDRVPVISAGAGGPGPAAGSPCLSCVKPLLAVSPAVSVRGMGTRDEVKTGAKRLAREAESNSVFEVLARAGYVANAIIHALIGVIVLVIAAGGKGEGDQVGALKAVAGAPAGFVMLWLIAIGLCALGGWHAAEGLLARDRSGDTKGAARKWGRRLAEWGQAVVFLAFGMISAAVAIGARPNADKTAEDASRELLRSPGGSIVLAVIGLAIGIAGVVFVIMGARRSFRARMRIPDGTVGRW